MAHGIEILLPFSVPRELVKPARHWRSTWVVSSLRTLKDRGHFVRYDAILGPPHREAVLQAVAGVWLSMDVARAHYETCERLRLPPAEQIAMGRAVGGHAQGTVLGTAVRTARSAGATPWTVVPLLHRLWQRGADGGDAQVEKLGPKDARLVTMGCELFAIPYFRRAFAGVIIGILELFAQKVYAHDESPDARTSCSLRLQWV